MLDNYLLRLCRRILITAVLWLYAALVKPGFIGRLDRKGCKTAVGICAAVTAFLFFMGIVAFVLLYENYRFG